MGNIIEVTQLEKVFDNTLAIKSVDFKVEKGEIFGFLGPSGSGKTTTIKILTGQVRHTSGTAKVFGTDVLSMKQSNFRKRFGVLTDNSGLYDRLSIYDNLKLYCDLYDVAYRRIEEVLNIVSLYDERQKRVDQLSKGMKQRTVLARTLLHEPELLFLDEPTSALDPVSANHIYDGLKELNEKGTTIFLTTHNMAEAEFLCDRVAFLNKGEIAELDSPKKLKRLYSNKTVTVELVNGESLILSLDGKDAEKLYKEMKENNVVNIQSNEPTLGDIFVNVTGRNLV